MIPVTFFAIVCQLCIFFHLSVCNHFWPLWYIALIEYHNTAKVELSSRSSNIKFKIRWQLLLPAKQGDGIYLRNIQTHFWSNYDGKLEPKPQFLAITKSTAVIRKINLIAAVGTILIKVMYSFIYFIIGPKHNFLRFRLLPEKLRRQGISTKIDPSTLHSVWHIIQSEIK